jgi:hypothetical protein
VIVVGKLVCVIYGTDGTNKLLITETRVSQAEVPCKSREQEGGSIALPHGKEGQSTLWTHSCGAVKNSCSSMYKCDAVIRAVIPKIE